MTRRALILLATYNGAQYLEEMLASLQALDESDWQLLISDDGSQDATRGIIEEFVSKEPRAQLLPARTGPRGHVANFEYLLQQAQSLDCGAVYLADQDDVWLAGKLQALNTQLVGHAAAFSDVEIISAEGKPGGAYLETMGLHAPRSVEELIAQNPVVGCSMALDTDLLDLALPFPADLENHDWWLALCALCSDGLGFCDQALVQYRQHAENTIGSSSLSRQWSRVPDIVRRQRRSLAARPRAVAVLRQRLLAQGRTVPPALEAYLDQFQEVGRWRYVYRLHKGPFRPATRKLLLIQSAAILTR